jgi:hypothetical protein
VRDPLVLYIIRQCSNSSHIDVLILEAFRKDFLNSCLVLRLDYAWSRSEYSERALSLTSISRLTGLKKGAKQLRPALPCKSCKALPSESSSAGVNQYTVICVLSCYLCHSISNFMSHVGHLLARQTL